MAFTQANKGSALKYIFAVTAVLLLLVASYTLIKKEGSSVVYTRELMGTVVQITVTEGDEERYDEAAQAAFSEISRLEEIFSSYNEDSDVSRINRAAGKGLVEVHPELIEVLRKAILVSTLTDGAFDPTVGTLGKVWGPSGEKGEVPAEIEIKKLLPYIDYRNIILEEHDLKAGLNKEGTAINLGGVAKGYIVERAALALEKRGVSRAIIHAGGDMTVFQRDEKEPKEPFKIGIQHPREKKLLGEAYVYKGAIATSGDYERFFMKDGVRYHHILDPKTGFPARGTQSVTLIAKDPTTADALSTAIFVLGPEKGMALIEELEGVEGVIVGEDGKVSVSKGFEGKIY